MVKIKAALPWARSIGKAIQWKIPARPQHKASAAGTFPLGVTFDEASYDLVIVRSDGSVSRDGGPHGGDPAGAIARALDATGWSERRAVFAVPVSDSLIGSKPLPALMNYHECMSNILSTIDDPRFSGKAHSDLAVQLIIAKVKKASTQLVSYTITTRALLETYRQIASRAGLTLIAVDHEAYAWQRALAEPAETRPDAILNLTPETATLVIFGPDRCHCESFDRVHGGDWITRVADTIVNLRISTENLLDPRSLVLFGDERDPVALEALENAARLTVQFWEVTDPRTGAAASSPAWLLAYGLAIYQPAATALLAPSSRAPRINLLAYDPRFRAIRIIGEFRTTLITYSAGLGLGAAAAITLWFIGAVQIHDARARLEIAQTQQQQLATERLRLESQLGTDIGKISALLPQIRLIRSSGEQMANTIGYIGAATREVPHVWLDTLAYLPTGITINGGAASQSRLGNYLGSLAMLGYHPAMLTSQPKLGAGVYFGYEIRMDALPQ
jgi:hypothetical protein